MSASPSLTIMLLDLTPDLDAGSGATSPARQTRLPEPARCSSEDAFVPCCHRSGDGRPLTFRLNSPSFQAGPEIGAAPTKPSCLHFQLRTIVGADGIAFGGGQRGLKPPGRLFDLAFSAAARASTSLPLDARAEGLSSSLEGASALVSLPEHPR